MCLSVYDLSIYLIYLSYLSYLCVYVSMCLCVYVSMCLCVYVSMCLCVYVSMCLCVYVSMCLCIYVSMYLCMYRNKKPLLPALLWSEVVVSVVPYLDMLMIDANCTGSSNHHRSKARLSRYWTCQVIVSMNGLAVAMAYTHLPKDEPLMDTEDGNCCIISLSLGQEGFWESASFGWLSWLERDFSLLA